MTDPEKDLLLSIFALDSYNQGYDIKYAHEKRQIGSANLQGLSDDIDLLSGKPQVSMQSVILSAQVLRT